MGRIFIARIEQNPFALRFTLWGTILTQWWGIDYTNKTLGEHSIEPASWREEVAYFREMTERPFIGIASGYLSQHGRRHTKVLAVDLPMGETSEVTHVLCAHIRIEHDESVVDILADCPLVPFTPTPRP